MFILLVSKQFKSSAFSVLTRTGQRRKRAKYITLSFCFFALEIFPCSFNKTCLGQLMFIKTLSKKALYVVGKLKLHGRRKHKLSRENNVEQRALIDKRALKRASRGVELRASRTKGRRESCH